MVPVGKRGLGGCALPLVRTDALANGNSTVKANKTMKLAGNFLAQRVDIVSSKAIQIQGPDGGGRI
jgi:hypothetical protein